YWAAEVEVSRLGAAAWTALAQGKRDDALGLMRSAADVEDKSEKHIVTPGRIVPAREALGEMLLEVKRPADALKEFEASQLREPERFRGYYGAAQAAAQSGDTAKARRDYAKPVEMAEVGAPVAGAGARFPGRQSLPACGGHLRRQQRHGQLRAERDEPLAARHRYRRRHHEGFYRSNADSLTISVDGWRPNAECSLVGNL